MYDFSGKVAIVTGAATGLGEAIAVRLSDQGAAVVVAGRDEKGGRAVADRLDPSGRRATAIVAAVRDHFAMKNLVDRTVERFGALHFAVNNAGITGPHGIAVPDYAIEDWNDIIATDLGGVFFGLKYEIPAIIRSGGG